MPGIDIFADDAFSTNSLTAAINEVPEGQAVPTDIDALFTDVEGISTTTAWVEKQGETLELVENRPRGAPGDAIVLDRRTALNFSTAHLPVRGAVMADEVQNIRAFGSESELQQVQRKVSDKLTRMRKRIQATNLWHRMGAIKGIVYDKDGSTVIHNLFTAFGVSQQTKAMALTTSTTKVRTKIAEAQELAENVIGDSGSIQGWVGLCGRDFFNTFVDHELVVDAYKYQMSQTLREGVGVLGRGFEFGDVVWRKLYGKVGDQLFITTTDAYLVPIVDGLFITRFGPADYVETVNTMGLPYYAKQERMEFDKGVKLEAQSNPLHLCTKPRAVIKLTKV